MLKPQSEPTPELIQEQRVYATIGLSDTEYQMVVEWKKNSPINGDGAMNRQLF
jgi:phosphoribosylformylglycinamidine synthase